MLHHMAKKRFDFSRYCLNLEIVVQSEHLKTGIGHMRIAVISDIHANLEAFETSLLDIRQQNVAQIICLGDNVGYGADPEAVLQRLKEERIFSILGNHDLACINNKVYRWYVRDVKKSLDLTLSRLSSDSLAFMKKMPSSLNRHGAWFVHGMPPDSVRHYMHQASDTDLQAAFDSIDPAVCFVGHTHRTGMVCGKENQILKSPLEDGISYLSKKNRYLINVGSVGQSRGKDCLAGYVIWDSEDFSIEVRCLAYDNATAAEKVIAAGMPLRFAQILDPDIRQDRQP